MTSIWKRITGEKGAKEGEGTGDYGVDYVGVSEMLQFNRNLLESLAHEKAGIEFYQKFLEEANDERGREMYRKLLEEEIRHCRMIEEEIEEHKRLGMWS